jgi:hypothetical protein
MVYGNQDKSVSSLEVSSVLVSQLKPLAFQEVGDKGPLRVQAMREEFGRWIPEGLVCVSCSLTGGDFARRKKDILERNLRGSTVHSMYVEEDIEDILAVEIHGTQGNVRTEIG